MSTCPDCERLERQIEELRHALAYEQSEHHCALVRLGEREPRKRLGRNGKEGKPWWIVPDERF